MLVKTKKDLFIPKTQNLTLLCINLFKATFSIGCDKQRYSNYKIIYTYKWSPKLIICYR